jgi:hypothetical protein
MDRKGDKPAVNLKKRRAAVIMNIRMTIPIALILILGNPSASADDQKRTLENDMREVYHVLPESASTLSEVLTKGVYYGRFRVNYLCWDYKDNRGSLAHDPTGFGLGGSIIYKTAPFHGVSATAGVYTSQNLGLLTGEDALYGRTGKDTFSRYEVLENGDWGMTVPAQAYMQYNFQETEIKIGRQIFESFCTSSNDTKMIPNTFEGYTLVSKEIPKTLVKLSLLTAQKLRDHIEFHDVITYDDGRGTPYSKWNNQDDSAAHRGISYANLQLAGKKVDNELFIAEIANESIDHMKVAIGYNAVPDLFSTFMAESSYEFSLANGWSLTPGLRYMQQFDHGAGSVGGAAISGALAPGGSAIADGGYTSPDSVDAKLYAARIVLKKGVGRLMAAYSRISDDADFISPWRGFPTAGYTRLMGQYNWEANTRSWTVQASYDFGKAGLVKGLRAVMDYTCMDYDDEKVRLLGVAQTDRDYLHADIWYRFPFLSYLEAKLRLGYIDAQETAVGLDPSYRECRFELNVLF